MAALHSASSFEEAEGSQDNEGLGPTLTGGAGEQGREGGALESDGSATPLLGVLGSGLASLCLYFHLAPWGFMKAPTSGMASGPEEDAGKDLDLCPALSERASDCRL